MHIDRGFVEWYRSASLPFEVHDDGKLAAAGVTLASVTAQHFERRTSSGPPETWEDTTAQVVIQDVAIPASGLGVRYVLARDAGAGNTTPAPGDGYRVKFRCQRSDGAEWIGVQRIRVMPEPNPPV